MLQPVFVLYCDMRAAVFLATVTLALMRGCGAALAEDCQGPNRVRLTAVSENMGEQSKGEYNLLTGWVTDSINLTCTGPNSENLYFISKNGTLKIAGQKKNSTTILGYVSKLDTGYFMYKCSDEKSGCTDSVLIDIFPEITVLSANARRDKYTLNTFIPYGEEYEVVCTGAAGKPLQLFLDNQLIETDVVNETSIKSVRMHENENIKNEFRCVDKLESLYGYVYVFVDYPPAATGFECIEKHMRFTCTWTVLTIDTHFTLFVKGDNDLKIICDFLSSKNSVQSCEYVESSNERHPIFVVQMRACNIIFCENQTFSIDRKYIHKLQAPFHLKELEKTNSHGIHLEFQVDSNGDILEGDIIDFKVEYKSVGVALQSLEHKSNCVYYPHGVYKCEGDWTTPCPSGLDKVIMYVKTIDSKYWSDPVTISQDIVDSICSKGRRIVSLTSVFIISLVFLTVIMS